MNLSVPDGAWGIRWPDLADGGTVLSAPGAEWPQAAVDVSVGTVQARSEWTSAHASYPLSGGHQIEIWRDPLRLELRLTAPIAHECVIAPHLSSAASTIGLWLDREALHAGAFLYADAAWIVLGHRGHGKSTTLGWLAKAGVTVIADDLVIHKNGLIFAGPRCVDLRQEAAEQLEAGRDLGVVGTRERWRLDLKPCPAETRLGGLIYLEWGPHSQIEPLSPSDRLIRVNQHRALDLPWPNPETLLELASYPTLSWQRPQGWESLGASVEGLLSYLERPV